MTKTINVTKKSLIFDHKDFVKWMLNFASKDVQYASNMDSKFWSKITG